jgi:hypothetical protein
VLTSKTRPAQQVIDFDDADLTVRKPAASVPAIVVPFHGEVAGFHIKQTK